MTRAIELKWDHRRYPTLQSFLTHVDPEGQRGYLIRPEDVGRPLWPLTDEFRFTVAVEECNEGQYVYLTRKPYGFEFRPSPRPLPFWGL